MHIVCSRQTATATSILKALLTAAGKDIRLKADGVSLFTHIMLQILFVKYRNEQTKNCSTTCLEIEQVILSN